MGCSSLKMTITDEEDSTTGSCNAFEAYKHLKSFSIEKIKKTLDITKEKKQIENIFLLLTNSMPNFINIIKRQKNLELEKNEEDDSYLEVEFQKYERDKNIRFLSNFVECWRLAEQDIEKENEFIIVEEPFIKSMNIKSKNLNKMKVKIEFDNKFNKSRNIILFNMSKKIITFEKKQYIFYKFIVNDENKSLMCDSSSSSANDKLSNIVLKDNSINININDTNINNSINNKNKIKTNNKNKNTLLKKNNGKNNYKNNNKNKNKNNNENNNSNIKFLNKRVFINNFLNIINIKKNDNNAKNNNKKKITDKKIAFHSINYLFPRNTTNFYHPLNNNKNPVWKI